MIFGDIIIAGLLILGSTFMLLSAAGLVRLQDVYLRMSASTKSATLGVASLLLATAINFSELSISSRALAALLFLLLTAPVAAHMIGRAAYFSGVPLSDRTRYDELKGHYDPQTHKLSIPPKLMVKKFGSDHDSPPD